MNGCPCGCIHEDIVQEVEKKMNKEDVIKGLEDLFYVFADSTRLKIIDALINSRMCVADIANLLNMSHSAISHQLIVLKKYKIVRFEKVGKVVYYELDDDHIEAIFNLGVEHVNETI